MKEQLFLNVNGETTMFSKEWPRSYRLAQKIQKLVDNELLPDAERKELLVTCSRVRRVESIKKSMFQRAMFGENHVYQEATVGDRYEKSFQSAKRKFNKQFKIVLKLSENLEEKF